MNFILKTEEDAKKILERYNKFHDGFIKSFNFCSQDYFDSDKNLISFGLTDIDINFAHCNYSEGNPPYNKMICASFKEVQGLSISFPEIKCGDWTIYSMDFIKNDKGFVIKITFDFFDTKKNMWTKLESISFAFKEADFVE